MVIIIYGHRLSDKFKVMYGFIAMTVLIIVLPLVGHFFPSPSSKFYGCFVILTIFGAFNGMVQGQVFGLGGILPAKYMGSIMLGNGLSGILMTLLRMLFVLTIPDSSLYF